MDANALGTVDEFIAWSAVQDAKYEFVDGRVSLFPSARIRHAALITALLVRIVPAVRPGRALTDTFVRGARFARVPDIVVTFDERDANDATSVRYPKLIVEVLSESTERVDRHEKRLEYQTIDSLEEYVLVDSSKRSITVYRRIARSWIAATSVVSGTLRLTSLDCDIDVDGVYAECGL